MIFQHTPTAIGCAVVCVLCVGLTLLSFATADNPDLSGKLMVAAAVVGVGGALLLVLIDLALVRQDLRRATESTEAIRERARERRRERARERGLSEAEAVSPSETDEQTIPPAGPVVEIPEQQIPEDVIPTVEEGREEGAALQLPTERAGEDAAKCPICQNTIVTGERFVTCPGCDTKHHVDCWNYNEGCGRYGCPW